MGPLSAPETVELTEFGPGANASEMEDLLRPVPLPAAEAPQREISDEEEVRVLLCINSGSANKFESH